MTEILPALNRTKSDLMYPVLSDDLCYTTHKPRMVQYEIPKIQIHKTMSPTESFTEIPRFISKNCKNISVIRLNTVTEIKINLPLQTVNNTVTMI